MPKSVWTGAILAACVALGVTANAPALAHHSFAMFDNEHQIKFDGTVLEFKWANPHVYIELQTPDEPNKPGKHWTIECASPSILNRVGWKFNVIKPGDKLTVIVAPMRSGQPGALLKQVTLPDGRKLGNGVPAGPPTIQ